MVYIVWVSQHAGDELIGCPKPLDDFEPVCLVNGEAHLFIACIMPVTIANIISPAMTPQNILKYIDGASKWSNKK
jgi:hypothetical protein